MIYNRDIHALRTIFFIIDVTLQQDSYAHCGETSRENFLN